MSSINLDFDIREIFGTNQPRTVVHDMIDQACNPQTHNEPDLPLELEILDIVKQRKTGCHEAAYALLPHINSRSIKQALFALHFLDLCVKNLDYPFHIQIGSKEFLNGLVKRFPERPPVARSPVIEKILELLQIWNQTICQQSKHKEDLAHIPEMIKLLGYKGYMFPELKQEDALGFVTHESGLKSKEEMEKEEQAEMAVKLQELLRRGTPKDLEEANVLMKKMAGYNPEDRVDYGKKLVNEIDKIEANAHALEGLLNAAKQTDDLSLDKGIQDAVAKCKTAQPRVQKLLQEEEEESIMSRLLVLNDLINRVVSRYEERKGSVDSAVSAAGSKATSSHDQHHAQQKQQRSPVKQGVAKEVSLIDFDVSDSSNTFSPGSQTFGKKNDSKLLEDFDQLASLSATGNFKNGPTSISNTNQAHPISNANNSAMNDLLDLMGGPSPQTPSNNTNSFNPMNMAQPQPLERVLYDAKGLKIVSLVDPKNYQFDGICAVLFKYINNSNSPLVNFDFQVAVPKGVDMKMEAPSGSSLSPGNWNAPVTQVLHLRNTAKASGLALRLRYRFTAISTMNGAPLGDQGETPAII